MELWRDIPGYENLYQVSNLGRVKALTKTIYTGKNLLTKAVRPEKIIKGGTDTKGYKFVMLYKNGVCKVYRVHTLVALLFIPNPDNKKYIDHINTNRTDNRVENLRWCTATENINNPITKRKQKAYQGEKHHCYGKTGAKNPKSKKVLCIETDKVYYGVREAGRITGINPRHISDCCTGRIHCNTAGGYHWKYID